jgi:ketosteroid isomerase-like protein
LSTTKSRARRNPLEAKFQKKEVTVMDAILKPAPKPPMSKQPDTGLVQAFTAAFTTDDVESFYKLIDPDCEWVIVATSETFKGLDQIKQLTMRSVAARTHGGGLGIKPTNIFTNAEGTKLCWEYMHTAVVTDKWPLSTNRPAPGTKIAVPIVLICDTRAGKLVKVREYFDLQTATEPGIRHKLYS